jgi:hypothetical protein
MYKVRDIFRCKPGKAKDLAARFKALIPSMEREDNFTNCRVMVDVVSDYWTVVVEAEFESLDHFERHMADFGGRRETQEVLSGYMELVNGGHREIFRIV